MTIQDVTASLRSRVEALEREVAALKSKVVTKPELEAALTLLRSQVNAALAGPFDASGYLGFDINDTSFTADDRDRKDAPAGQFVTDVETYYEDGHIKLVFYCKKLHPIPA